MKKFLVILVMSIISMTGTTWATQVVKNSRSPKSITSTIRRSGNTFGTVQTSQVDIQTPYNWKDKDGQIYPIYISKKGACYVKRVSKKTDKEYKYYLPKEVQEQIRKELGMQT